MNPSPHVGRGGAPRSRQKMKEQPYITIDCHFERNEKSPPIVEQEISPKGRNDKGEVEVPRSARKDRRKNLDSRLGRSRITAGESDGLRGTDSVSTIPNRKKSLPIHLRAWRSQNTELTFRRGLFERSEFPRHLIRGGGGGIPENLLLSRLVGAGHRQEWFWSLLRNKKPALSRVEGDSSRGDENPHKNKPNPQTLSAPKRYGNVFYSGSRAEGVLPTRLLQLRHQLFPERGIVVEVRKIGR